MGSPNSEVMLATSSIDHQPSSSHATAYEAGILQNHQSQKSRKLETEARTHKVTFDSDSIQPSTSYGRKDEINAGQSALGLSIDSPAGEVTDEHGPDWPQSRPTSDISRTPSQSTTGTVQSHNSLETAASSLQSAVSAAATTNNAAVEKEINQHGTSSVEKELPPIPSSPRQYVTACSTPVEMGEEKREAEALRRYHALLELIETERGYTEDLNNLVTVFFPNLVYQPFFEEDESRLTAVSRNGNKLHELHSALLRKWDSILEQEQLRQQDPETSLEKALRCGDAIRKIVQQLQDSIVQFQHYRIFCSRHSEAMVMIREAERRHGGDDFAAYERLCGNLIRTQSRTSSTPSSRRQSFSRQSSGFFAPLTSSGILSTLTPADTTSPFSPSSPSSGTTTPSSPTTVLPRSANSHRLLLADYLIKPVQRMCLYPLVLSSLLKNTPPQEMHTRMSIQTAIESMRRVADEVDEASRIREKDLMAQLILTRIEPNVLLPQSFVQSLGAPQLSGTLDVLHHHSIEEPLTVPLRFQRLGVVMWSNFVLIARTRKNGQLDCRYWFPLAEVSIVPNVDIAVYEELNKKSSTPPIETHQVFTTMEIGGKAAVPHGFRLSLGAHHFEFSASNERERRTWHDALRLATAENEKMKRKPSEVRVLNSLSSLPGMTNGAVLVSNFLSANVKATQANSNSLESLVKFPSASTRATVDRNMVFSDVLIAPAGLLGVSASAMQNVTGNNSNSSGGNSAIGPSTVREISEALMSHQLRQNSAPSIGSAVGAAMGLAKLAATQMPNVKRPRRMNSLTPIDSSVSRPPMTSTISETSTSSSSESNTTPKRNSLNTLRANTLPGIDTTTSPKTSVQRISSPVESISSRVKGTLRRANSRLGSMRSTTGSLPASPMNSAIDLGRSASEEQSTVEQAEDANETAKPAHARRKSVNLREVWKRRSRSQSAQGSFTMGPSYESFSVVNRVPSSLDMSTMSPVPTRHSICEDTPTQFYDSPPLSPSATYSEANVVSSAAAYQGPTTIVGSKVSPDSSLHTTSAPTSQASSRRQSVASIFANSYTDLQRAVQTPLRSSSPSLNMTQMREDAANTLKRAKSLARNRFSMYGVSTLLTSASSSTTAQPLASATNARGYFDTKNSPSSKNTEKDLRQERSSIGDLSPGTVAGDQTPVNSGADSAINQLRDSLGRNGSTHRSKDSDVTTQNHHQNWEKQKDLSKDSVSTNSSPKSLAEKRFPTLQSVEETASSAEQSRDETYSSFPENSP
jgi:RhoGEF domain